MAQTLDRNLTAAKTTVSYVRTVLDFGSDNKFLNNVSNLLINKLALSKAREMQDKIMKDSPNRDWATYIEAMAMTAKLMGAGNCGENAAVAFVHLRDVLRILPIDYYMYNNFEHAFVIVGRRADTDPTDYNTWNREAAICDPWRGISGAAPAFPYANLWFIHKRLEKLHRVE